MVVVIVVFDLLGFIALAVVNSVDFVFIIVQCYLAFGYCDCLMVVSDLHVS